MIPTPPFDAALPHLATLLDDDAMTAMLADTIAAPEGADVVGCQPRYVRYKPGTSCLIQYEITYTGPDGCHATAGAHIVTFADDRGLVRAKRSRMRRLVDRAASLHQDVPFQPVVYMPSVNGLFHLYPIDYDLPALARAADAGAAQRLFRASLGGYERAEVVTAPGLIRYKPGRKAMLRYHVRNAPRQTVYGKVRLDARAGVLREHTDALIEAGVPTPPVVAVNTRHGFVAHAEAPGVQLASLRGTSAFDEWMEPLALSLRHLQSAQLPETRVHRLSDEISALNASAVWLERIMPELAGRLDWLSDDITARLASMDERFVTGHGDFYDDQALVGENGVVIIDLDELRRGHPLLDAGNMLAHLRSGQARGEAIGSARESFLDATLRHGLHCEPEIAVFEAAALLKLAPGPFRRLEPDWPDGVERIVGLAESTLTGSQRSPRRDTGGSPAGAVHRGNPAVLRRAAPAGRSVDIAVPHLTDPMLPQLGLLQDQRAMSELLTAALGNGQVSVNDIEVVRHKVGRRAILRYQLGGDGSVNGHDSRLYGKTFASGRGPKVHEIACAIASTESFGPNVALPEPVAYLPDLKLLVQRSVAGESIVPDLLDGNAFLAERIAGALHSFHTSGLRLDRSHDLAGELAALAMRVEQVEALNSDIGETANACLRCVQRAAGIDRSWRCLPVHRDFYHDQVLTDGGHLAVLDLDDAAMSDPAVDVANFAAHLILLAAQHPAYAGNLASVRRSFTGHYRALDHDLDHEDGRTTPAGGPALLRFLTATTLLRLAGIHVSRTNGEAVARALLTWCERLLTARPEHTPTPA